MQKANKMPKKSSLKKPKDESEMPKTNFKDKKEDKNSKTKSKKGASKVQKTTSKIQKSSAKAQKSATKIQKTPQKTQKDEDKTPKVSQKVQKDESKAPKKSQKFLARQEKIKATALKMFIAKGYEETSLKDIIKKSGGSFSDIYATFKNKEGLFLSVIEDMLEEKRSEYAQIFTKNLPLRDTLLAFSLNIINSFLQKKTIALLKMLYSQLYNKSNYILIEHFKENREKIPELALITYFQHCPAPLCDEPEKYAEIFFTMLKGKYLERMFFFEVSMNKKEQEEHAEFIVDFFIKALR